MDDSAIGRGRDAALASRRRLLRAGGRGAAAAGFEIAAMPPAGLTPGAEDADVLVIAHPSDPAWERTTGSGSPRLDEAELDAISRSSTPAAG